MFDKPTHTRVQTSFPRLPSTHVTLILNTRAQLSSPWHNYATKHKDKGEWEQEEAQKKRKLRFSSFAQGSRQVSVDSLNGFLSRLKVKNKLKMRISCA